MTRADISDLADLCDMSVVQAACELAAGGDRVAIGLLMDEFKAMISAARQMHPIAAVIAVSEALESHDADPSDAVATAALLVC